MIWLLTVCTRLQGSAWQAPIFKDNVHPGISARQAASTHAPSAGVVVATSKAVLVCFEALILTVACQRHSRKSTQQGSTMSREREQRPARREDAQQADSHGGSQQPDKDVSGDCPVCRGKCAHRYFTNSCHGTATVSAILVGVHELPDIPL